MQSHSSGFVGLMDKNSVDDVRRMHVFLLHVDGTPRLRLAWNLYIKVCA
jgi:hypothetical protein